MIPVQRFSLTGANGARLDIQTTLSDPAGSVDASGFGITAVAEVISAASSNQDSGVPPICIRADDDFVFFPLQLREHTDYYFDALIPIPLADAGRLRRSSPGWPFRPRMRGYVHLDPPSRWREEGPLIRITGRLNFRSRLGLADLGISTESWPAEVVASKLGYLEEYKTLLSELASELVELLLDCDSPSSSLFGFKDYREHEYPTLLFHLRRLMAPERLPLSASHLRASPHSRLTSEVAINQIGPASSSDPSLIAAELGNVSFISGGPLASSFRGLTPTSLPSQDMGDSYDTPENRYVKAFFEELLDTCYLLTDRLRLAKKAHVAMEVQSWAQAVDEWLSWPMWDDVGAMRYLPGNSQVLQRRRGYRDVFAADLELQYGISLPWSGIEEFADGLLGDLRPVTLLYEYWCFFVLRTCLRAICGPETIKGSSFFGAGTGGLTVNLKRGRASRIRYRLNAASSEALDVSLFYNRHFPRRKSTSSWWQGSYTVLFKPDYSILVKCTRNGSSEYHWLHFDAKYRFDRARVASIDVEAADDYERDLMDDEDMEESRTFQQSDLWKMHTYRDAIFGSRGAYILYPGSANEADVYVRKPGAQYPSTGPLFPSVGAFSLRPQAADSQRVEVQNFLNGVLNQIARAPGRYQDEVGYETGGPANSGSS